MDMKTFLKTISFEYLSDAFESVGVTNLEVLLKSSKANLHKIAQDICLEREEEIKFVRAVQTLHRLRRKTPISRYLINQMTESENEAITKHASLLQQLSQFQQKLRTRKKEIKQMKEDAKKEILEHFANATKKLNARRDVMLNALENVKFKAFDKCFNKVEKTVDYFEKLKELCEKALKYKKSIKERSKVILQITEQAQSRSKILQTQIPDPKLIVQFPSLSYQDYGYIHSDNVFDSLEIDIDLQDDNTPISKCLLEWNNIPQATQYIVEIQEVDEMEKILSIKEEICKENYFDLSNLKDGCTYKLNVTPSTNVIQGISSYPILFTLPSITSRFITSYSLDEKFKNESIEIDENGTIAYVCTSPGGPIRLDQGVPINNLMYWEIMILDQYRCGGLYGGICDENLDMNTYGRKIVGQESAWVLGFYSSNFYHKCGDDGEIPIVENFSERYRDGDIYGFLLDRVDATLSVSHQRQNQIIQNLQIIIDDLPLDDQLLYPFLYFGCHTEAKFKYIYYEQIPRKVIRYIKNKYNNY